MRRLLAVSALCCSLVAIAAAPKTPVPSPKPVQTAVPVPMGPPLSSQPTVIVYPFDVGGGLPKNSGAQIEQIFDESLNQAGGITVITPSTGITRSEFLNEARRNAADFYVSGFLTAVGDSASMVMQVVDTTSGAMVFSQSSQITSASDAASQALTAREVILARSGVSDDTPEEAPSATPSPSSQNGTSVSVSNFFGLLKRHGTASPAPTPTNQKPSRITIVARVEGSGFSGGQLTSATQVLTTTLDRHFTTRAAGATSSAVAKESNNICGIDRDATIIGGSLTQQHIGGGFNKHTQTTFAMRVYTCFGAVLYDDSESADSISGAIEATVQTYVAEHPENF